MLVDNAVVVLENIYRRHSLGEPPFTAAVRGTQEVWGAVVASTLTTVAVFLPVVFVQEQAGQLFRDIALAISAAVSFSLVVSMIVIPPAAARLFRKEEGEDSLPWLPATLSFDRRGGERQTNGQSGSAGRFFGVATFRAAGCPEADRRNPGVRGQRACQGPRPRPLPVCGATA
jgi:HAE1 family hydrophobic/amphiphilic exporter-1